jgi:hypothetical protein
MEKTAKILSVQENQRQWEWQGTKFFDHYVKIEGSDQVWTYASKSDKSDKIKAGETLEVQMEVQERNGNKYYKIKPSQTNGNGAAFSGKKADPKDQGMITFLSLYSSTCNFYAARGQATIDQVLQDTEKAFKAAMNHSTLQK